MVVREHAVEERGGGCDGVEGAALREALAPVTQRLPNIREIVDAVLFALAQRLPGRL